MLLVPAAAQASGNCLFKPADTVFKNGYVYTVNRWQPTAQAVAVRDGKIIYVGCNQVAMWTVGPNTKVVDLHGKMMMPGLEDGHTHLQQFVVCDMGYEGGTEDYILGKIKAALLRADQVGMLNSNYVLNASYFSEPVHAAGRHGPDPRHARPPEQGPVSSGTPWRRARRGPSRVGPRLPQVLS